MWFILAIPMVFTPYLEGKPAGKGIKLQIHRMFVILGVLLFLAVIILAGGAYFAAV